MTDTTLVHVPPYLDEGSWGWAVWCIQTALCQHESRSWIHEVRMPEVTGHHTGAWVEVIRDLQVAWDIGADGGMGPDFRQTAKRVSAAELDFDWTPQQIAQSTVWYGPDTSGPQLSLVHLSELQAEILVVQKECTLLPSCGFTRIPGSGDGGVQVIGYDEVYRKALLATLPAGTTVIILGSDAYNMRLQEKWMWEKMGANVISFPNPVGDMMIDLSSIVSLASFAPHLVVSTNLVCGLRSY